MSELTFRTVTDDDDHLAYVTSDYETFLFFDPPGEELDVIRKFTDYDRQFGFLDGDRWVATTGSFSNQLVLPGGSLIPVAAVSAVAVAPTHRRRGLLTRMMRHQLDDLRSRGEAVAMLFASEAAIYGRFGYGVASQSADLSGQMRDLGFRPEVRVADGAMIQVDAETLLSEAPAIYDRASAALPGTMARPRVWWDNLILDTEMRREGTGRIRFALFRETDGAAAGYAIYRAKREWDELGSKSELHVVEVRATNPAAYARVWRYLLDMDLIRTMEFHGASVDEPLRHLVADYRALQCSLSDGIYVRLVDVATALAARSYATDIEVVLEVSDDFCPWNAGRYRLRGGPAGAVCESTTDAADIALGVRELGAVYLGGGSLLGLANAGLVSELTPGSVQRAAVAFGWPVAPTLPDDF